MLTGTLHTGIQPETTIEEISVRDDKQQYTDEFTALLSTYYLKL
jgi:hypothetical protein